jgi:hypothetical protein
MAHRQGRSSSPRAKVCRSARCADNCSDTDDYYNS